MAREGRKYTYIIIILSVLLTISLVVGATFAWFISEDRATATIKFGDAVELNVITGDDGMLPISINGAYLLPGMDVEVRAGAVFTTSTTPALLRARVSINISDPSLTEADKTLLKNLINSSLSIDNSRWLYYEATNPETELLDGGWWYYYHREEKDNIAELSANKKGQVILHRINSDGNEASRTKMLIDGPFTFPTQVGNKFANVKITLSVTFQAVQAYIPPFNDDSQIPEDAFDEYIGGVKYRKNKIENIVEIFMQQFGD